MIIIIMMIPKMMIAPRGWSREGVMQVFSFSMKLVSKIIYIYIYIYTHIHTHTYTHLMFV